MAATTIRIVPPRLSARPSYVLLRLATSWAHDPEKCAPVSHQRKLNFSRRPHLFKIVEGPNFRPEDMHDDVAGVDQHPVALPHALDTDAGTTRVFQVLDQVVGDSADMTLRPAAGHDHVIANRGFSGEIDNDAVLGFHVFETGEDGAERLLGTWVPGYDFELTGRHRESAGVFRGAGPFDVLHSPRHEP